MANIRKNEKIAEIIRQKEALMKMLKERMLANNIILQDHELKYKAEKAMHVSTDIFTPPFSSKRNHLQSIRWLQASLMMRGKVFLTRSY